VKVSILNGVNKQVGSYTMKVIKVVEAMTRNARTMKPKQRQFRDD
jgi:hypothetical protein